MSSSPRRQLGSPIPARKPATREASASSGRRAFQGRPRTGRRPPRSCRSGRRRGNLRRKCSRYLLLQPQWDRDPAGDLRPGRRAQPGRCSLSGRPGNGRSRGSVRATKRRSSAPGRGRHAPSGRTLYVVENGASQIAVIQFNPSTGTGTLVDVLPVNGPQTPTTSALFGSAVYTVDARLATPFSGPTRSIASNAEKGFDRLRSTS